MMSAFVVKRTQLYLSVPHSWAKNSAMNNIMFVQLIRYTYLTKGKNSNFKNSL